jgi:hypothetical protein
MDNDLIGDILGFGSWIVVIVAAVAIPLVVLIVVLDALGRIRYFLAKAALAGIGVGILVIKRHRVRQLEHRLAVGEAFQDRGYVFANETGGHLHPNVLHRRYAALIARAGVPAIRFHDLRHTSATLLLAEGVHGKIVQERLGHANIATTLDLYSHVTVDMQRHGADQLDALIGCHQAEAAGGGWRPDRRPAPGRARTSGGPTGDRELIDGGAPIANERVQNAAGIAAGSRSQRPALPSMSVQMTSAAPGTRLATTFSPGG